MTAILIAGCVGFIIGGIFGVVGMAMMAVASKSDDVLLGERQYEQTN